MKKRILALILTVVMSLLALTSCGGYDFAKEDLSTYVDFNLDSFLKSISEIKIANHDFNVDEATREKIVKANIYNSVVSKLLTNSTKEDRFKTGALSKGDAIYFVYYAEDAEGNMYFGSDMNVSAIESTTASIKANHSVKLGDFFYTATATTKGDEKFLQLVIDNVISKENIGNIEDYAYSMLTKAEIEAAALEALKATKPDATDAEKTEAKNAALTVKAGDTISVTYTVKYTSKEGAEFTKKATNQIITLDAEDAFHALFLAEGTTAMVGSKLSNADNKFEVTDEDGIVYSYSDINIDWKVENMGDPIATFEYAYNGKKEVKPSTPYDADKTVDINGKKLTYHVYPVYAVNLPAYEEITAYQILYHALGSNLSTTQYEAFSDTSFKYGDESIEKLLKDFTDIYNSATENNSYYKEGGALYEVNKAHTEAKNAGGTNPTDEQKKDIATKLAALNAAKDVELKKVLEKIAAATSGDKKLADLIIEQHNDNIYDGLLHSYNNHITSAVQTKVYALIKEIPVKQCPAQLVEEFKETLYDNYENEFYTGTFDTTTKVSNFNHYGNLEAFLLVKLNVASADLIDAALTKKAEEAIKPMLRIHAVAQALNEKASKDLGTYLEADIKAGKYTDESEIKFLRNVAGSLIVDKAYMKQYKKWVGSAVYRDEIKNYGELNLKTAQQTEVLLNYLLSYEAEYGVSGHAHGEPVYKDGKIAYRTIKYSFE